ncbi:hypothetical protein A6J40_06635 [Legionella longbeachae]|uniref:hypothetical protein n=1 Tax=Legionella longbeachae TaxID=450 RepID=UPI0009B7C87A|nr:hypothetical protein [Legionella longbeachae]ARB91874.1 hypothetical protein A6J40_06635 [Legionella longbeachae]RZV27025.1 hypothetical protein EKG34_04650 [Legionella longbeachae]UAK48237.1 hypothetical protein K8O86_08800 [Legionella longbeachae]VEE01802.1 Uncharacterised protein [Legionella oakridgensis]
MKIKINGWQRLWVTTGILYFFVIVFMTWTIFPTETTKEYVCNDSQNPFCDLAIDKEFAQKQLRNEQISILENAFLMWILPLVFLYIVGLLIKWTYEGFKKP